MSENILIVEYEPKYAERVRAALQGQPFQALFVKDGEEAMRALDTFGPKLIVLSSVVPKISAPDLIRVIRGRGATAKTPVLLTVSGYTGTAPKQDAVRMGASDLLPKPYTEAEFLAKVQQMLGVGQLTSNEIFGDILEESAIAHPAARKPMHPQEDVEQMLDRTLAGVMGKKNPAAKPKTAPGISELDKRLQDTLSGLEKSARRTSPGTTAVPHPAPPPTPAPPPAPKPEPLRAGENVSMSQPVFPPAAVAAVQPAIPEEEPTDGIRFGQYVLLERIASGGMAEVWKARMRGVEGFQKIVAIKKILPHLSDNQEFIEMFVDEAKLAAQLNHNNIVHIYDLGKIGNSFYIAMEYVDGHDLKSILKRANDRDSPLGVEIALFVASKVASALDYAHRKRDYDEKEMSLVHRDVSPQNVLISQDGDIKLCDFGIAKAASKASHTQVGALKGKIQYMSPEQAAGKPIDRRSDIFALGTVLFEMLTGRKLFTGDSEISILEQVREARGVPPSQFNDEVTAQIDGVVFKAHEKDPAARYQTAGEMARDIDSILYEFRPTPTSADLAIYMHRIWSDEPARPKVEESEPIAERDDSELAPARTVAAVAAAAAAPAVVTEGPRGPATTPGGTAMPAWEGPSIGTRETKRSPVVPVTIAAVLVAALVGGFFWIRSRGSAAATSKVASKAPAPAPVPVPTTTAPATDTTASTVPATATTATVPTLDQNLVNQEVQKRLAAERARLDEQTRTETAAPAPAPSPPLLGRSAPPPSTPLLGRSAPPQQQPAPVTQTVAPPPVQTASVTPAPPPPTTATEAPAEQTPPPAPAEQTTVREGDLVQAGTDGLVPPRILRRGGVPYPPMARAQRVQGTVVLSVLVSETGQVLQVRI
ncbi:MAG: protein kinase domain-containing protein, partial [Thermoanaerobaculia bacterium]